MTDNRIVIAGCGPGSPEYVTPAVNSAVNGATVLAGAPRLLELFPDFKGVRVPVGVEIEALLELLASYTGKQECVVVLVTGDPGISSLALPIVRKFGADHCRIIPGISSVQTAFARLALDWTGARIISAHAKEPDINAASLVHEQVVAVVGGNAKTWPWIISAARRLSDTHTLHICRELSTPTEVVRQVNAAELNEMEPGGGLSILVWVRKVPPTTGRDSKVYFVGAGPGDPELLTRKAERLLRGCKCCIWAGSLVNPALLNFLPADAERHDSAGMTLDEIVAVIERCHKDGIDVVRLHTGEPALFGAIGEQMTRLNRLGIEYEVVPGISSFQAAAALKTELTSPEISQAVMLTRAPGRTPVPDAHTLEKVAHLKATLCVFLSTDRIGDVVEILKPHYGGDCPAAVVYHASWPDEKTVRGTLNNIAALVKEAGLTRTGMIIVGQALAEVAIESRLYAADFGHGYRKAGS